MEWLRLYTEIIDDPKISKMDEKTFKIFIFLLCYAQELNENGVINRSISDIAWRLRTPENVVNKAINTLISLEILSDDQCISFCKWSKRQYKSDNVTARVARHRHKETPNNVTLQETLQNKKRNVTSNVIDTDTEQIQNRADNKTLHQEPVDNHEIGNSATQEKDAFLKELKTLVEKASEKYNSFQQQQEIINFIKNHIRSGNKKALIHCLNSLIKAPDNVRFVGKYLKAAFKIEDGKHNAEDEEKRCNEFKNIDVGNLSKLLTGIGKPMPGAR